MKTNLQAVRKAAGYKSAVEFAKTIGINEHTYTAYEQGRVPFTLEQAWEFADIFGCTLDELAGRTPPNLDIESARLASKFQKLPPAGRMAVMEMLDLQLFKSRKAVPDSAVSDVARQDALTRAIGA